MNKNTGENVQVPEGVGLGKRGAEAGGAGDLVYTGWKSPDGVVFGNGSDGILIPGGSLNLAPPSRKKAVRNIGSGAVQDILNRRGNNE